MKKEYLQLIFIFFLLFLFMGCVTNSTNNNNNDNNGDENVYDTHLYLFKAMGALEVGAKASTETYETYFHIPISFEEQVPILVKVESPQLIDYRFLHLNPPNVMVAARMMQANTTIIKWEAWVLITDNRFSFTDLPDYLSIPTLEQLPDWTKKWLSNTGCAQVDAPLVQQIAAEIRGDTTNLRTLTDDISSYCDSIPGGFDHSPTGFDAVYALRWGNSCTGHAHAGAALLRANGIPARSILNIMPEYGRQDMHWIVDYYIPDYGWGKMETTLGRDILPAKNAIVTMVCYPGHEFPVFYPGIEGFWHTSDPILGIKNPQWGRAHEGYQTVAISVPAEKMQQAYEVTQAVFDYYTHTYGINLDSNHQALLDTALDHQTDALSQIKNKKPDEYIAQMQEALNDYEQINVPPTQTLFFDDFEGINTGWTHGGINDEWERGTPLAPIHAYSGNNCWGTDLDDNYENNADCWLLSPPISLNNLAQATLNFRVWNWVQDGRQGVVYDPLWLDITTDGTTFYPLCSYMGGVNDDPEIPDNGGWNILHLDLTKYIGQTIQIRFRFQSNDIETQPGSYIDDVTVTGASNI